VISCPVCRSIVTYVPGPYALCDCRLLRATHLAPGGLIRWEFDDLALLDDTLRKQGKRVSDSDRLNVISEAVKHAITRAVMDL